MSRFWVPSVFFWKVETNVSTVISQETFSSLAALPIRRSVRCMFCTSHFTEEASFPPLNQLLF